MQKKANPQPPSAEEVKAVQYMKSNPEMRTLFINKVAAPIANKMFACGMIPKDRGLTVTPVASDSLPLARYRKIGAAAHNREARVAVPLRCYRFSGISILLFASRPPFSFVQYAPANHQPL